jgi:hypothetical protein
VNRVPNFRNLHPELYTVLHWSYCLPTVSVKTSTRVAQRYVQALNTIKLEDWGLEGMLTGKAVPMYHGTTRLFHSFDISQSRAELVNSYYGAGIFLTPSKRVAVQYAEANRNMGFPPSIIDDLKRKNPMGAEFLKTLYDHGMDGWEIFWKEHGFWIENPPAGVGQVDMAAFEAALGVTDSNIFNDVAEYIVGSKVGYNGGDSGNPLLNSGTGTPGYVYDDLDQLGLNSKVYRPKVYTVSVTVSNPLLTNSQAKARKAKSQGYDSVVYFGPDLVGGVPEVAVFSPKNAKVRRVEVV